VLIYAVESTMYDFLQFLDENEIGVLFQANNGRVHDVWAMSDGFAGEPYSDEEAYNVAETLPAWH